MISIKPIDHLDTTVKVPGSKSYTQRALIIAALAEGKSFLRNPLISEDTSYLIEALRCFGTDIRVGNDDVIISGTNGTIRNPGGKIYLGNNGTALRFLTSVAALGDGPVILDGSKRLRERPVKPLLDVLKVLGISSQTRDNNGYPPVTINGTKLIEGGKATFTNIESSQFVSSLLIASPFAKKDVEIDLAGHSYSLPYIDMTIEVMKHFGVDVIRMDMNSFMVKVPQRYKSTKYFIEGDVSSASYFFLAATLCRGTIKVPNINAITIQGDIKMIDIMEELGCSVYKGDDYIEITGRQLREGKYVFNMADMPDMVPTLAIMAAFRKGQTVITDVPHLRFKESNRIEALVNELKRIGIKATETDDGIIIDGGRPRGAFIETYDDHRIAMSFAIAGLVTPGMIIKGKNCVKKSFPDFWNELNKLYSK